MGDTSWQMMVGDGDRAPVAVEVAPLPSAAPGAASARLGYVDGLRALAALYVVLSHIMYEVWPHTLPQGVAFLLTYPAQYGHFAVSVFIVLSGFSLMLPVARRGYRLPWGAWGFYWRRARRILPPYYFALGLSLLLIWLFIGQPTGTHWDVSLPVTPRAVVEHVLLLQDFSVANYAAINHVFWSIALECQIYLFFPLLILPWRRYPKPLAAMIIVAGSLALLAALSFSWVGRLPGYAQYEFAPQYFGLFALGMFAASVYTAPSALWNRLRAWYLWEGVALVCGALVITNANIQAYRVDLFIGPGTVGLLLAASRPGRYNPIRAALEWRPLVWVGGISYSVYLIHAPLIQLLWQYALHPLGLSDVVTYLALLLGGGPLIVLASWGFWYCCERPFLNSHVGATTARSTGAAPAGSLAE